jgi:hypothetical protein
MLRPLLILISFPPLIGCAPTIEPTPPVIEDALLCDVIPERAWFTQAEIDGRVAAGWTRNLAWQYAINLAWDRECDGSAEAFSR